MREDDPGAPRLAFFDFNDKPVARSAALLRRAILFPIAQKVNPGYYLPSAAAKQVVKWWRLRLQELLDFNRGGPSSQVSDALKMVRFANCCPSSVRYSTKPSWACHLPICPWCSTRKAQEIVKLFGVDSQAVFEDVELFRFCYAVAFRPAESVAQLGQAFVQLAEECRQVCQTARRTVEGGYWHVDAEPVAAGWQVYARIALLRDGKPPPLVCPAQWSAFDAEVNRKTIDQTVLALFRYPLGLVDGPIDRVDAILKARHKLKLAERIGSFRKKRSDAGTVRGEDSSTHEEPHATTPCDSGSGAGGTAADRA